MCSKWKPGQPDNWTHGHEEGEDCAGLIHEAYWNDFYCIDRIGFICELAAQCEVFFCVCDFKGSKVHVNSTKLDNSASFSALHFLELSCFNKSPLCSSCFDNGTYFYLRGLNGLFCFVNNIFLCFMSSVAHVLCFCSSFYSRYSCFIAFVSDNSSPSYCQDDADDTKEDEEDDDEDLKRVLRGVLHVSSLILITKDLDECLFEWFPSAQFDVKMQIVLIPCPVSCSHSRSKQCENGGICCGWTAEVSLL